MSFRTIIEPFRIHSVEPVRMTCETERRDAIRAAVAWRHLPLELGFGSGATCYRRLDEWQKASRHEIHEAFLALGCCLICFRRLQNSL